MFERQKCANHRNKVAAKFSRSTVYILWQMHLPVQAMTVWPSALPLAAQMESSTYKYTNVNPHSFLIHI